MTPQECVLDAVLRAHGILADYVEQGPRHCQATIARLFAVLDDQELIAAVNAINLESMKSRNPEPPLAPKPPGCVD